MDIYAELIFKRDAINRKLIKSTKEHRQEDVQRLKLQLDILERVLKNFKKRNPNGQIC